MTEVLRLECDVTVVATKPGAVEARIPISSIQQQLPETPHLCWMRIEGEESARVLVIELDDRRVPG